MPDCQRGKPHDWTVWSAWRPIFGPLPDTVDFDAPNVDTPRLPAVRNAICIRCGAEMFEDRDRARFIVGRDWYDCPPKFRFWMARGIRPPSDRDPFLRNY